MVRPGMTLWNGGDTTDQEIRTITGVVEMRMLRFSIGVTGRDKIRNKLVRKEKNVISLHDKLREQKLFSVRKNCILASCFALSTLSCIKFDLSLVSPRIARPWRSKKFIEQRCERSPCCRRSCRLF